MPHVSHEIDDHVAVVTLDRPEALNAFTDAMEAHLIDLLDELDADDDVRVVVLTGAGRAFCAGMDLAPDPDGASPFEAWRRSPDAPPGTTFEVEGEALPVRRDGGGRVSLRLFALRKPVIAAINGHAAGVGVTMTLPCDLRLLADHARLSLPFVERGFVAESCSSWFLPRLVPMQTAMEWVLTGRTVGAEEALRSGLVRSLHPAAEVLPAALELAGQIAAAAPVSVSFSRQLMWRMSGADHPVRAHQLETAALNRLGLSEDAREGVASFLEKRAPHFGDRVSDFPDLLDRLAPAPGFDPEASW